MMRKPGKLTKSGMRKKMRLTRPPRMEGKVKNAGLRAVRKPKRAAAPPGRPRKPQGYGGKRRKDYQLGNRRHR